MFPESPPATKISFPKVTPLRRFPVGEVTLSQVEPLSVDLTMVPELPTPTNTPKLEDELSEVLVELSEVLVELSEESSEDVMGMAVAVVDSSFSEHEETITAMLTIRTNQDNIIFILLLKYKMLKK